MLTTMLLMTVTRPHLVLTVVCNLPTSYLSIIFITLINKTQTHKFVIRFPVSASNLQRERILQFPLSSRLSCIGDSLK